MAASRLDLIKNLALQHGGAYSLAFTFEDASGNSVELPGTFELVIFDKPGGVELLAVEFVDYVASIDYEAVLALPTGRRSHHVRQTIDGVPYLPFGGWLDVNETGTGEFGAGSAVAVQLVTNTVRVVVSGITVDGGAWAPATPSGGGGMAIGGAVSGATAGQNLYVNASGNLANRAQVSSGTASPAAALDIVDPTVVISNTLPTGQTVARWENGAADGFASTLELVHTYHPAQNFDSWSFVCKSGYNDLPNYPRLTSSFGFGAQSGVGQFSLKTMGLKFVDSGITLNETTYPAAGTLRMNLPASQYFYIYDAVTGRDLRFSAAGFFISKFNGRANLEAHDRVIARGADAAKVPFTAQAFASQTADVAQFTDSGGAAMAGVTAKGGIYPATKTVTELASITATAGVMYFCSNESGGAVPVFGDGTNWRRVTDRAIAS